MTRSTPEPDRGRPALPTDAPRIGASLVILIVLCVLAEAILLGADHGLWGTTRWRAIAYENGGFWNGLLRDWRPNFTGQPVAMFLTYGFLHSGLMHLCVNMLTLLGLGSSLVGRVGQGRFILIYCASVFGGALGFGLLSQALQPMVGASGALFGLAGALTAIDYHDRAESDQDLWPVARSIGWLIVLNIILWWAMDGLLAWQTHLGGFIAGAAVAMLVKPAEV